MKYSIGIDIGSTCTKTAVLDEKEQAVLLFVQPTGWSSVETAQSIHDRLCAEGFSPETYPCVATGYGRVAVPFADKTVTEITCHVKGAIYLHKAQNMTVIDIGGQDTKVIQAENGAVRNFIMNDKCSAGTGRFLEVMATTLSLRPDELCRLAESGSGVTVSSMCTVFAESEVVSLIGRGEKKENIAYAVVNSIVQKVASQASHLDGEAELVCLTGGLCECAYIRTALGRELKKTIVSSPQGRYAGALGAAICAAQIPKEGVTK